MLLGHSDLTDGVLLLRYLSGVLSYPRVLILVTCFVPYVDSWIG